MARFSKNVISQVSGFDTPLLSGELVWDQKTYWNLQFVTDGVPVDLTGATVTAQIIRRTVTNLVDTRNGLSFDVGDFLPTPDPIDLTIANFSGVNGSFTVVIDDTTWDLLDSDEQLTIDLQNPVGFTGNIKVALPEQGDNPAQDWVVFLFFLVRSDGVVKV